MSTGKPYLSNMAHMRLDEQAVTGSTIRPPTRVRHPLRARRLRVVETTMPSTSIHRICLSGDLADFPVGELSPGDHVRLVLPDESGQVVMPTMREGRIHFDGPRPIMRDMTPRLVGEHLMIDICTEHEGPAVNWARNARPGSEVGVLGPRGSRLISVDNARSVVIADATALPAVGLWLEAAPAQMELDILIAAAGQQDYLAGRKHPRATVRWFESTLALTDALVDTLVADSFVWAAGEAGWLRDIRRVLMERGVPRHARELNGYWRRGEVNYDHHEPLDPSHPEASAT